MSDVLTRICADKREHVAQCKRNISLARLDEQARAASAPRGFLERLRKHSSPSGFSLIAEIKMASPSKGLIRADFDPQILARAYAAGGATCLSVLTDSPYFMGEDSYLVAARSAVDLPVLRKDFMIDPYQIVESRALGADCILLIMAAIDDTLARELADTAKDYGMDVLVEVHNREELDRALEIPSKLIGINNRNLKTLTVRLETTLELCKLVPDDHLVVAESGLFTHDDLKRCAEQGVTRFLIGESLMRQADVTAATRKILGET